jgi:hypothetical protein
VQRFEQLKAHPCAAQIELDTSNLNRQCPFRPAAPKKIHPPCPPQIDLDTIETSNLNRQFLFRKRHVGQSKAAVAAEAVRRFAPSARIYAHQVHS